MGHRHTRHRLPVHPGGVIVTCKLCNGKGYRRQSGGTFTEPCGCQPREFGEVIADMAKDAKLVDVNKIAVPPIPEGEGKWERREEARLTTADRRFDTPMEMLWWDRGFDAGWKANEARAVAAEAREKEARDELEIVGQPSGARCDQTLVGECCELPAGHSGQHRVESRKHPGSYHQWGTDDSQPSGEPGGTFGQLHTAMEAERSARGLGPLPSGVTGDDREAADLAWFAAGWAARAASREGR